MERKEIESKVRDFLIEDLEVDEEKIDRPRSSSQRRCRY